MSQTPKNDQLEVLRKAQWERRYGRGSAKPAPAAPEKVAIAREALKLESNASPLSNGKSNQPGFDKRAYQREYMRKRRAPAEKAKANV